MLHRRGYTAAGYRDGCRRTGGVAHDLSVPDAAPATVGPNCTVNVILWDGVSVTADPPVNVNCDPVSVTLEIATLELPVFVTVTFFDAVALTFTFPKLTLEGFTDNVNPAAMPVPDSVMGAGELVASVTKVRFPFEAAAVLGLNCTLNVLDCPPFNVKGRVNPLVLKPVPVMFAADTFTLIVLGLLICTVWLFVRLVTTFPKLIFPGDTVKLDPTAVPDRLTLVMPPWELTSETLSLFVPAAVGANFTVSVKMSPGAITTGALMPLVEYTAVLALICESVRFAVPVFFSVVTAVAELPTFTLLKLRLAGVAVSFPTSTAVPTPVRLTVAFGAVGSSLAMVTLPVKFPAAFGEKLTFKVAVPPAGTTAGTLTPVTENVAPVAVTLEIFKSPAPELVSVNVLFATVFTVTLPKSWLAAEISKFGAKLPADPVRSTGSGTVGSPVKWSLPFTLPGLLPLNETVNLAFWPA